MPQTSAELLSRPAFQRQELGPLLTAAIPGLLEFGASRSLLPSIPWNLNEDSPSNHAMLDRVAQGTESMARSLVDDWMETQHGASLRKTIQLMLDGPYRGKTFYDSAHSVVREGAISGMVVPINLSCLLMDKKLLPYLPQEQYKKGNISKTLRAEWFRGTVHRLAWLPNGILQDWSTQASAHLTHGAGFIDNLRFEEGEDGPVLSGESQEEMRKKLEDTNRYARSDTADGARNKESGGCPVRHGIYKSIGPIACSGIQQLGVDSELFSATTGQTGIELFLDFVADKAEEMDLLI